MTVHFSPFFMLDTAWSRPGITSSAPTVHWKFSSWQKTVPSKSFPVRFTVTRLSSFGVSHFSPSCQIRFMTEPSFFSETSFSSIQSNSSMSNVRVALGGICGGLPAVPYAYQTCKYIRYYDLLCCFRSSMKLHFKSSKDQIVNIRYSGLMVKSDISPFFIVATPSSHPLITLPVPSLKVNTSFLLRLESKIVPSCNFPT